MIPRKDFVRIMNKKAAPLIESCKATSKTLPQDCRQIPYFSDGLHGLFGDRPPYGFDSLVAQSHYQDYINIIAELEDKFHVLDRMNSFYKSTVLSSLEFCPDDLVRRLKDPTLMPKALEDWKLTDEFLMGCCAASPLCMPDRIHASKHPNTGILLIGPEMERDIDAAVNELIKSK